MHKFRKLANNIEQKPKCLKPLPLIDVNYVRRKVTKKTLLKKIVKGWGLAESTNN